MVVYRVKPERPTDPIFRTRLEAFNAALERWEELGEETEVHATEGALTWCEAKVTRSGDLRPL